MADYGLLGAIGEGLSQGANAYRQQTNFAEEMALKKRLARAQEAETAGKLYDELGYLPKGVVSPETEAIFQPQKPEDQPMPEVKAEDAQLDNAQEEPKGLVQKPEGIMPQGLVKSPQQPQASTKGIPEVPLDQDYVGTRINPNSKRGRDLIQQAMAHTATLYGKGARAVADLDSGQVRIIKAPLSSKEDLEIKGKELENKNKALEPELKTQNEYRDELPTKNVKETAFNYQKLIEGAKLKSPLADKGLVYNYIRLENPGAVAREGSLEDIRNMPGLYNKYANEISMAMNGTMSDEMRRQLLLAGTGAYIASRSAHKDVVDKYTQLADERGTKKTFLKEPGLEKLDKQAAKIMAENEAMATKNEGGPGLMTKAANMVGGLFGKGSRDEPSLASDKIRVSNGKETFLINPSDLKHAKKDGFRIIK